MSSTQPNAAFGYRRHGVQAGTDFAVDDDGRFGASVRRLQGSAEMPASVGEIGLPVSSRLPSRSPAAPSTIFAKRPTVQRAPVQPVGCLHDPEGIS